MYFLTPPLSLKLFYFCRIIVYSWILISFSEVNLGPMAIFQCFLVDHKDTTSEEDKQRIRQVFIDFMEVSRYSLSKHARHAKTTYSQELHQSFVEGFNKYAIQTQSELGFIPQIEDN